MNNNSNIFDKSQLIKCILDVFLNNDKNVIQHANSYIMEAESHHEFLPSLIEAFEAENNLQMKNQLFLVFKNALKRKLKGGPFDATIKNAIIEKLVLYMQHFKEVPGLAKNIQSSVLDVVETEFPFYKALMIYLKNGFDQISAEMNKNPAILTDTHTLRFFKEVKNIFKRKRQTQVKNFPKMQDVQFREYFENIVQTGFSIMNLVANNFQNAFSNESFLQLSALNDEIILMILQYIHGDSNLEEMFRTIIEQMFQKCSMLVQTLMKDPKSLSLVVKKVLNKNLIGILYSFSHLQYHLPFMFNSLLKQYLDLIRYVLDNNASFSDERILKSGLVCFFRFLKSFAYFADTQTFSRSLAKNEKLAEKVQKQLNVSQNVNSLFSEGTIEIFLFSFLQNILIREFNKQKNEENYENLIEIDNEVVLEDTSNELENSIYNLTLVTVENLFQRFPKVCFEKMNNLTHQLISLENADQIEKPIQDGIFALLGVIPKVFMKLKVDKNPAELIDILKVLEFLKNNLVKDVLYARRFASLAMKWMNVLNAEVLKSIADLIYQILLNFNHHLIQYESMKCLHELIKTKNIPLNFQEILMNIVPIIINIIEKFNNPSIICPLIEFLNLLLEKTQFNCPQILATAIQTPSFKKLIQNDSDLLRNAICEMFKSLVVSFNANELFSNILIVSIEFIDQSFQLNQHSQWKGKYEGGVLKLWLLILKEYNIENQNTLTLLRQLFQKYRNKILGWSQENDMDLVVEILEENLLMDFTPANNDNYQWLVNFIEKKYEFTNQLSHPDSVLSLKISILSLLASFILKLFNQNQNLDFKLFEKIIGLTVFDILRPKWLEGAKKSHGFRTSLISLINRFLIKNAGFMADLLHRNGKLEEFVSSWIYLMKEISSENACKINIIAVYYAMAFLEKTNSFFANFEEFINNLLSNFNACLKYDPQSEGALTKKINNVNLAETHTGISKRKEMIRKTNLFVEIEIKIFFTNLMEELLYKKNFIQFVKQPHILEKLKKIVFC